MATLASLQIRLEGDASGLNRTMDQVEGRSSRLGKVMDGAVSTALGFAAANVVMSGMSRAFDFAGEALFGYNARMEQAQIGFTTLLGSADKATAFIKDLQTFAAKTPFDFPGLQTSANRMLAMGFASKDILPTLTSVGDAVAALGQGSEAVDRATFALGQMKAAGRVNAQDMNQLTSIGIPAWKLLADSMHLSVAETRKLSEQGLIPAEKGIKAIVEGIEKGNMAGMMAEQANTMTGALSTIQDTVMQLLAGALQPLFVTIRDIVVAFSAWVQGPDAAAFAARLGAAIGVLADVFSKVIKGVQALVPMLSSAGGGFRSLLEPLQPIVTAAMDVFTALGYVFEVLASGDDVMAGLVETTGNLGEKLLAFAGTLQNAILEGLAQLLPMVAEGINQLATQLPIWLSALLPVVLAWVVKAAEQFMAFGTKAVGILIDNLPAIINAVSNLFQGMFDWIVNVGVPMAAAAIGPLALKFIDWVFVMLPKLLDALDDIIFAILGFIVKNGPVLVGKLLEWAVAFVGWIATEVVPRLIANLPTILRTILMFMGGALISIGGKALQIGASLVTKFIGAAGALPGRLLPILGQALGHVVSWAASIAARAASAATGFVSNLMSTLGSLPGRFASFLGQIVSRVTSWVGQMASGALKAARDFVGGIIRGLTGLPGALYNGIVGAIRSVLPISIGPLTIGLHAASFSAGPISQTLATYAKGTGDTGPRAHVAIVHPHELIAPKPVATWFRQNGIPMATPQGGGVPGGGNMEINVHIDEFYGTEENITRLGSGLAREVRRERLRSSMDA